MKKQKVLRQGAMLLAVISIIFHANGAVNQNAFRWNVSPTDIDAHPERLWDWTDPQFARL